MLPKSVVWEAGRLRILDQTRLPDEEVMISCDTVEVVFESIQNLRVRGAPAIGIAAAYGLLVGLDAEVPLAELETRHDYLVSARPTAVNLSWALRRMLTVARAQSSKTVRTSDLLTEAQAIHDEDAACCRKIGDHGADLLVNARSVLTHCNAGALAVSEYGTALAPIYRLQERGENLHVYVDETRPLLQGARLTSYELSRAGVPCTLITDNMAAHVMSLGKVDAVIVGSDRVTANGDVVNKIGTLNLAILCQHYELPFYVACPCSTVDLASASGVQIEIEHRSEAEVTGFGQVRTAPEAVAAFNPAFDVTPAKLVTALITERGVLFKPDTDSLAQYMS